MKPNIDNLYEAAFLLTHALFEPRVASCRFSPRITTEDLIMLLKKEGQNATVTWYLKNTNKLGGGYIFGSCMSNEQKRLPWLFRLGDEILPSYL